MNCQLIILTSSVSVSSVHTKVKAAPALCTEVQSHKQIQEIKTQNIHFSIAWFLFPVTERQSTGWVRYVNHTLVCSSLICGFSVFTASPQKKKFEHLGHTWKCMNVIALNNKYQKWRCNGNSDRSFFLYCETSETFYRKRKMADENMVVDQTKADECVVNNVNIKNKETCMN